MTQEEMANRLGVTAPAVNKGKRKYAARRCVVSANSTVIEDYNR